MKIVGILSILHNRIEKTIISQEIKNKIKKLKDAKSRGQLQSDAKSSLSAFGFTALPTVDDIWFTNCN